jgi:hypothetical protein
MLHHSCQPSKLYNLLELAGIPPHSRTRCLLSGFLRLRELIAPGQPLLNYIPDSQRFVPRDAQRFGIFRQAERSQIQTGEQHLREIKSNGIQRGATASSPNGSIPKCRQLSGV